jgi:hypothetical protein
MEGRKISLLSLRPNIEGIVISGNMSEDEKFQNITIRPILKFQNDLFIEVFRNYIKKRKNAFYQLTLSKQIEYIKSSIQKDIKFRNFLKGIVIGQFTVEEYLIYIQNSSALNKRIMNMVSERLISQIQLFQNFNF